MLAARAVPTSNGFNDYCRLRQQPVSARSVIAYFLYRVDSSVFTGLTLGVPISLHERERRADAAK
jgi:hypothetical protein